MTEPLSVSCPSTSKSRTWWRIAVLGWIGLIFFSSTSLAGRLSEQVFATLSNLLFQGWRSIPGPDHPIHFVAEKGVHVTLFAVLAVLLWQALPDLPRKLGYVILAGTAVGCGSEFLQRFFPGRDPALRDVCINVSATALGALISRWLCRSNKQLELL